MRIVAQSVCSATVRRCREGLLARLSGAAVDCMGEVPEAVREMVGDRRKIGGVC